MDDKYEKLAEATGFRVGQTASERELALRLNCKPEEVRMEMAGKSQGLLALVPLPPLKGDSRG